MVSSRRAISFEGAASCPMLTGVGSLTESLTLAGAPPGKEETAEQSDSEPDSDGFAGMLVHGLVGSLRSFGRSLANAAKDSLAAVEGGGKPLALRLLVRSLFLVLNLFSEHE